MKTKSINQTYLTKEGLKKLKSEHNELVANSRREAAQRIKASIESGGYDDNPLYEIELEKRTLIERRILDIEEILRESKVIEEKKGNDEPGFVVVGAVVVVEAEGEKDEFKIVGSIEANPIKRLISNESPVGQALLGAKIGDVVEVTTPVVKLKYKVLEIKYE